MIHLILRVQKILIMFISQKKTRNIYLSTWVCFELIVDTFDDSDVWFEFEHESLCIDETGEKPISR